MHTLFNKKGSCVFCKKEQVEQMMKIGYEYKENPIKNIVNILEEARTPFEEIPKEIVKKVTKEAVPPKNKTTRRSTRKSAQTSEKDIIL
jgi:hypothetical protein